MVCCVSQFCAVGISYVCGVLTEVCCEPQLVGSGFKWGVLLISVRFAMGLSSFSLFLSFFLSSFLFSFLPSFFFLFLFCATWHLRRKKEIERERGEISHGEIIFFYLGVLSLCVAYPFTHVTWFLFC